MTPQPRPAVDSSAPDTELAARAGRGDTAAFEALNGILGV